MSQSHCNRGHLFDPANTRIEYRQIKGKLYAIQRCRKCIAMTTRRRRQAS